MPERKVILITGCSSGIGLSTAVYLAERGYTIIATMRDVKKTGKLEHALGKKNLAVTILALDVTKKETIQNCIEEVLKKFGRIDALVNNAGITIDGFFEDLSEADTRKIFEVNFFGVLETTRQFLPIMRRQGKGQIITIGSIAGQYSLPQISIYSSTKFALEGWTEGLRYEVAPFNIKVSIIEPCFIKTDMVGINRLIGENSNNPKSPYSKYNEIFETFYEEYDKKNSKDPIEVAKLVYKAIQSKHPKIRYMLGRREKLFFMLKRILPQSLFEKIYNRVFPDLSKIK